MTVTVRKGTPREAQHLLEASHALMESLFPSESNHYLSIEALEVPTIAFFVAETDRVVGCAALADKGDYGEVKSMFVDPATRGQGVGDALLAQLIEAGRAQGFALLRLETGNTLEAAHRMYRRAGFRDRGPFGDYPDDPISLFMELAL